MAIIVIAILILAGLSLKAKSQFKTQKLNIADKVKINVTVADSNQERTQGYSNHPKISYNEGLLFVFPSANTYQFWMKDMLFDLDFIFIRDKRVVYLLENIKAPINNDGQIEYAISPKPFDQLLEVKAGFIEKYQIIINDSLSF